MKLNNKGFAFSTMLYGTLALITIILYAIFAISQSSNDTTYYYGEVIEAKLNECLTEEISLENCYSSGSSTCNATSYHACLGLSDNAPVSNDPLIADKLKTFVVTSGDGLKKDPDSTKENRYVYVGNNVNNYLNYADKTWRILSVEPEGTVKLVDYSAVMTDTWDRNAEDIWNNSTLFEYLSNEYIGTFSDTSKMTSGKWIATIVYPSMSAGNLSLAEYSSQEASQDAEASVYSKVGILSIADYMKASSVANCQSNMLTATGCTSWLSNYKGWTLNINGEQTEASIAYFFNTVDSTESSISQDNTSAMHQVYPVIVLNRNSVIASGNGSASNPYVLK
jgi:hypothetical protein